MTLHDMAKKIDPLVDELVFQLVEDGYGYFGDEAKTILEIAFKRAITKKFA
jgi:hypothetical protein